MSDQDQHHDHSHGHDHGHDHAHSHDHGLGDPFHPQVGGPLDTSEFDPASKSLADALKLSFGILRMAMIALVVVYALSGAENVKEGHVAVRMLFGKLMGEGTGVTKLDPGFQLWVPKPVGKLIMIPTSNKQVAVNEAFWFGMKAEDEGKPLDSLQAKTQLVPGEDGSLLTGDKNLVHGRWTVTFQIDKEKVDDFLRNVSSDDNETRMVEAAQARVAHAAERAILHVVATVKAEDFIIKGVNLTDDIAGLTQKMLDELKSGIRVVGVTNAEHIAPLSVRNEFRAVSDNQNKKAAAIENARREAEKTLTEAAGAAHAALSLAIDYYETARTTKDDAAAAKGEKAIRDLFDGKTAAEALAPFEKDPLMDQGRWAGASTDKKIGGMVSSLLLAAQSYRKSAEETAAAEEDRYKKLHADYKKNPQLFKELRWNQTLARIFAADIEIRRHSPDPGKLLMLELNPDPRLEATRKQEQYKKEQDAKKAKPPGQ